MIVGGDVLNSVGSGHACVDDDGIHRRAVEEGCDAEVGVSRLSRPGVAHGRAKISVAFADLNDGGVVAVDGDGRRGVGRRGG